MAIETVAVELDAVLYEPTVVLAAVGGDAHDGVGIIFAVAFRTYKCLPTVSPTEGIAAQCSVEQAVGTLAVEALQTVEVRAAHDEPLVGTHAVVAETVVLDGGHHLHIGLLTRPLPCVGRHHEVGDAALDLWLDDDKLPGTGQREREGAVGMMAGIESKTARIARGVLLLAGASEKER